VTVITVAPPLSENSSKAADNLAACLNYAVTRGPEHKQHRNYFSACGRWWSELKPDERETALVVLDAYAGHRDAAEAIAALLPAAPKCPL
jgi:hypothetical protein